MNTYVKQPDIYWNLLSDTPFPAFYSGKDTKLEHAQMQWLYQGAMIHMTLQGQVSMTQDLEYCFQYEVPETGGERLYSPIGYYMDDSAFEHYAVSHSTLSTTPDPFCHDLDLQKLVSDHIGWELTADQAMMLMHLELIHDNYPIDSMFEQFDYVAIHFGLFSPSNLDVLRTPTLDMSTQTELGLIH